MFKYQVDKDKYVKIYIPIHKKNKTRGPNHDLGDLYFYLIW